MFDFGVGYTELFVLAVVAVIVIGPKDLPRLLRSFGQFMNKAKGMAREFQTHVDAAMKESGVAELKKDIDQAKGSIASVVSAPDVAAPLAQSAKSAGAKSFEQYFGATASEGETRVAGQIVEGSAAKP